MDEEERIQAHSFPLSLSLSLCLYAFHASADYASSYSDRISRPNTTILVNTPQQPLPDRNNSCGKLHELMQKRITLLKHVTSGRRLPSVLCGFV
jgi:hypothetical protein